MKRILILISIMAVATACLGGYDYNYSGVADSTFEFNYTVFNEDSLYFDKEGGMLCCLSDYPEDFLAFYHKVDKEAAEFKGGFMLSYLSIPASEITEGLKNNMYRVNMVGNAKLPNRFAVFCQSDDMPEKHLEFWYVSSSLKTSCVMDDMYVNNTLAVAEALAASEESEYKVTLRACGYKTGQATSIGEASILLAEKNAAKDSVVSSWTHFDLSKLGTIDYVQFIIETQPEGLDIPKTVCMDNIVANVSIVSE